VSCTRCGGSMQAARRNVRYDAVGLKDVLLRSVEIRRCRWCDEYELVLPHLDDLHRMIAHVIIGKRGRLAPAEIPPKASRLVLRVSCHASWRYAGNDVAVGDRHDPDGRHR
jgi:hypothetical protein